MPDLSFSVTGARAAQFAAVPTLLFRLAIEDGSAERIGSIMLRCQVRIATRQRDHSPQEQAGLFEVFGEPERWGDTLKPLLWTQAVLLVPAFQGATEIELPVACTYDLEVTAAKYLQALDGGGVPLEFLFSGTVFVVSETGFRIAQIPWSKEARFRMPVHIWRDLMEHYFPGCSWIRLRREGFDALERFKAAHGLPDWDAAVEALLEAAMPKVER
jgi:hypothetical protein